MARSVAPASVVAGPQPGLGAWLAQPLASWVSAPSLWRRLKTAIELPMPPDAYTLRPSGLTATQNAHTSPRTRAQPLCPGWLVKHPRLPGSWVRRPFDGLRRNDTRPHVQFDGA